MGDVTDGLMMLAGISEQPSQNHSVMLTSTESTNLDDISSKEDDSVLDIMSNAKLDDMILSKEAVNLVSTRTKSLERSRLVSIMGKSVITITVYSLRLFATNIGLTHKRSWSKYELVHALVEFSINPVAVNDSVDVEGKKKIFLNRRRFCNVLFSDKIRPHVALRGKSLGKDDLTAGLKTDQELHMLLAAEYNTPLEEYGGNAFPLLKLGRNSDASIYDDITWQKVFSFSSICQTSMTNVSIIGNYPVITVTFQKKREPLQIV